LSRRPADVAAAFDAAERSGTVLAEAFMYRYHPATTLARQLVDDGAIGELAYVKGTLSFTMEGADVRLSKAVDEDPRLNTIATPTFAPDAAELICTALERQVTGTQHCCGGEHIDRVALARRAAEAFGFDPERVSVGAPDPAVASARYGRRAATISRTGADPFGEFIHDALRGFGVDDRWVTAVPGLATPVTFCEIFPPDDFPLYFYREPKAPDLEIHPDELDFEAIRAAKVLWVTVTGLSQEPSRTATLAALRERTEGISVLDLDYLPMFWPSREEARRWVREALQHVTVAAGNLDESDTAVGSRDPRVAADTPGLDLAVVKQGPKGVLARRGDEWAEVPPVPVEVVNGLGAGDAFGGALCHGLLAGWDLERTMRFCNAAGALVASRLACADAMPTEDEVEAILAAGRA